MITRTDAFGSNAVLNGRVAFDQADGQSAKPADVLASVIFMDAGFVLAKGNIHYPMQRVFDSPVASHGTGKSLGVAGEAVDVISHIAITIQVRSAGGRFGTVCRLRQGVRHSPRRALPGVR